MKLGNIFLTAFTFLATEGVAIGACQVTVEAVEMIKYYESFQSKAYRDTGGGWWAIGYGSNGKGIGRHTVWTQEQAERRLRTDIHFIGLDLCTRLRTQKVKFTVNQFNALLSFAYNAGLGAATNSKLIGLLKNGKVHRASSRILLYVKSRGKVLPGLVLRRKAERDLFLKPDTGLDFSIYRRSY